jgi:hypothetical protein
MAQHGTLKYTQPPTEFEQAHVVPEKPVDPNRC